MASETAAAAAWVRSNWMHVARAGYTLVDNRVMRERSLSARAKGIYCQIRSAEANPSWRFTIEGIAACVTESAYAVRNALKELERAGYLLRAQRRHEDGTFATRSENMWITLDDPALFESAAKQAAKKGYNVISKRTQRTSKGRQSPAQPKAAPGVHGIASPDPLQPSNEEGVAAGHPHPRPDRTGAASDCAGERDEPQPGDGCSPAGDDAREVAEAAKADAALGELMSMSLKPVARRDEAKVQQAWDRALARGIEPERIIKAYELYIETYEASNGSNLRYAKLLARWLTDGDGLPHYLRQGKRASQEASSDRLTEDDFRILRRYDREQQSHLLASVDAAYVKMLDEFEQARLDRSLNWSERDEILNRLYQRAQRYMNSKTKYLASYIREKEQALRAGLSPATAPALG